MGKNYSHLTSKDRIAISTLLRAGHSKAFIAKQLGVHRSTIYREVNRNSIRIGYLPFIAESKIKERYKRTLKLKRDPKLRTAVFSKLALGWSPEQIAGRLKRENQGQSVICHETIYAYIYSDYGIRNKWFQCLRRKQFHRFPRNKRKSRTMIPNRTSIQLRPVEVNTREIFGHWEGDLMIFKRNVKTNLITLRERKSRMLFAIKNENKTSKGTADNIINRLKPIAPWVSSLTFDNGSEFCDHENIAKELFARTYFCEPYKSYQKGSIENANGLLREWLPRECAIEGMPRRKINFWVRRINQRPMKCLGYQTPQEIFYAEMKKTV